MASTDNTQQGQGQATGGDGGAGGAGGGQQGDAVAGAFDYTAHFEVHGGDPMQVVAHAASQADHLQGTGNEAATSSSSSSSSSGSSAGFERGSTPSRGGGGAKRCAVVDCEQQTNGNRTLCARHQKRKERGEELVLKDNHVLGHRKKQYSTLKTRQKSRRFKDLHETVLRIAGEKDEVGTLLQEYMQSNFFTELNVQAREPSNEKKQVYEAIGRNAVELFKSLPPRSPFRRDLLKYLIMGIKHTDFAELAELNPDSLRLLRTSSSSSSTSTSSLTSSPKDHEDIFRSSKFARTSGDPNRDIFFDEMEPSGATPTTAGGAPPHLNPNDIPQLVAPSSGPLTTDQHLHAHTPLQHLNLQPTQQQY